MDKKLIFLIIIIFLVSISGVNAINMDNDTVFEVLYDGNQQDNNAVFEVPYDINQSDNNCSFENDADDLLSYFYSNQSEGSFYNDDLLKDSNGVIWYPTSSKFWIEAGMQGGNLYFRNIRGETAKLSPDSNNLYHGDLINNGDLPSTFKIGNTIYNFYVIDDCGLEWYYKSYPPTEDNRYTIVIDGPFDEEGKITGYAFENSFIYVNVYDKSGKSASGSVTLNHGGFDYGPYYLVDGCTYIEFTLLKTGNNGGIDTITYTDSNNVKYTQRFKYKSKPVDLQLKYSCKESVKGILDKDVTFRVTIENPTTHGEVNGVVTVLKKPYSTATIWNIIDFGEVKHSNGKNYVDLTVPKSYFMFNSYYCYYYCELKFSFGQNSLYGEYAVNKSKVIIYSIRPMDPRVEEKNIIINGKDNSSFSISVYDPVHPYYTVDKGSIEFRLDGVLYVSPVKNGSANFTIYKPLSQPKIETQVKYYANDPFDYSFVETFGKLCVNDLIHNSTMQINNTSIGKKYLKCNISFLDYYNNSLNYGKVIIVINNKSVEKYISKSIASFSVNIEEFGMKQNDIGKFDAKIIFSYFFKDILFYNVTFTRDLLLSDMNLEYFIDDEKVSRLNTIYGNQIPSLSINVFEKNTFSKLQGHLCGYVDDNLVFNISDNYINYSLDNLSQGSHQIKIIFFANDSCTDASYNFWIDVEPKIIPNIQASTNDCLINEKATIKIINKHNDLKNDIIVKINNKIFYPQNNLVEFYTNKIGLIPIEVIYPGDNKYESITINLTLNVKYKWDSFIHVNTITPQDIFDNITFKISVPNNATGKVSIKLGDKVKFANVINGKAEIVMDYLKGTNNITAVYYGDDNYENSTYIFQYTLPGALPSINIISKSICVGETAHISVNISKEATGIVVLYLYLSDLYQNYGPYQTNISNGKASFIISNLPVGSYKLTLKYEGDERYRSSQISTYDFQVKKNKPSVHFNPKSIVLGETAKIEVNITNATGNVEISYLNTTMNALLNNGNVIFYFYNLSKGLHSFWIKYSGNDYYSDFNYYHSVTVYGINPNVTFDKSQLHYSTLENEYFLLADDNLIINTPYDAKGCITLTKGKNKISAPIYDGKAVFLCKDLSITKYSEEFKFEYSGDEHYESKSFSFYCKLKNNIIIDAPSLEIFYGSSEQYIINLKDNNGNPLNSEHIKIDLNNNIYNKYSDENGEVFLDLSYLNPGTYEICIYYYCGVLTSNITVKSTIVSNISVSNDLTATFKVIILDSKGRINYYNDVKIYIGIIGSDNSFNIIKSINSKTNNNGYVIETIDLNAGNYTIEYLNVKNDEKKREMLYIPKINSKISLDYSQIEHNLSLISSISSLASGNMIFSVNNKNYSTPIKFGKAEVSIPNLKEGYYPVKAYYLGDKNFNPSNSEITCFVDEYYVIIDAPSFIKNYGDDNKYTIKISDNKGNSVPYKNIKVIINGTTENYNTDYKGEVSLSIYDLPGQYDVKIICGDVLKTSSIIVNPIPSQISLTLNKDSNNVFISAEVTPSVSEGKVIFNVDGKEYIEDLIESRANLILSDLDLGEYNVIATFTDNHYYSSFSNKLTFNIEDNFVFSVHNITKYYKGSERFTVSLIDNNKPISNEEVKITINGNTYIRTTDTNGLASMSINLNSGRYDVVTEYHGIKLDSKITVKSTVSGNDVTKIFRNGTQYYAKFVDTKGNLMKNTDIKFNINGVFYTRTTDNNGIAKMNINLNPGTYIITAENPNSTEKYTNVIKVLPSIVENHDLTKYYKNASKYTLRILGDNGKPVGEGVSVKLNINGVFYERKTNTLGYINMNINLPPGKYTVTAEYNGLKASNTITVLSILQTKDLSMKYHDGSMFEAKILDSQGKHYAGQTVTFNINGVFYNKVTGEDGIARLTINLMAGEYIITSTFNGLNAANKVTISS